MRSASDVAASEPVGVVVKGAQLAQRRGGDGARQRVLGQRGVGALGHLDRLVELVARPQDVGDDRVDAGRRLRPAVLLVERDGRVEALARGARVGLQPRGAAGLVEQRSALLLVVGQLGGAVEGELGLAAEGQRQRAPARLGQRLARRGADPRGVRGVGVGVGGGQEVRGEDFGHLTRVGAQRLLQVAGGGQVPRLAVAARERPVGDGAQQALQEAVLAALG